MARGAGALISTRIYAVLDLEDDHLPDADRVRLVVEEQDVAALEGGLHAAAEHHDDRRLAFREEHQSFPDHQRAEYNHGQVEALVQQ